MKLIKICMAAAVMIATTQIAEATIKLPEIPAEKFQKRPPPPPDPLHLFSGKKKPVRKAPPAKAKPKITLPKVKLPPPPPRP